MAALDQDALHGIARMALKQWSVADPRLELISHSENTVFRVVGAQGRKATLRIHRLHYHDLDELTSECLWAQALKEVGVDVPLAVPTKEGRFHAAVPIPGANEVCYVGLVEWVEGATLRSAIGDADDVCALRPHFRELGRVAARIHNQAGSWRPPAGFRRPAWDAAGLLGEHPLWGRFWEHPALTQKQRRLLLATRRKLHEALLGYGKSSRRYGLIHADLHPDNLLLRQGRLTVLDFDDAGYGWHAYELAVAVYDYLGHPNFNAIVEALVAGYRELRTLADREVDALPLFLTVRSLALLGWIHLRPDLDRSEGLPSMIDLACQQCYRLLLQPDLLRL